MSVIPLILYLRTNKHIYGVEIQSKLADMAKNSVSLNNLTDKITIINKDMKDFAIDNIESFDVITCNPPYFKVNEKNYFNISTFSLLSRLWK